MRSFLKAGAFLAVVAVLPACDVYDQNPTGSLDQDQAFASAQNAEAVVTGAYNAVQNSGIAYLDEMIIFADLAADNAQHTGSFPSWLEVDSYNLQTNNAEARDQWIGSYDLINTANNLIANIGTVEDMPEARRNQIIGEARTLRAFAYHHLVKWFGGVPLVLEPTTAIDESSFPSRASVDAVYAQILDDLTQAESLVPATTTAGRIDRAATQALLARVYLYRQQWQQAADKALEVINSGFTLASLSAVYETGNSTESIWEIQHSSQDPTSMGFYAYPSSAGGRREYAPTTDFVALFDSTDARRPFNIDPNFTSPVVGKYTDVANGSDGIILLRLPEMHFIRAEALVRLNFAANKQAALDLINPIRARAGLAAEDGATITTEEGMVDFILDERRIELAFEGHRYHDLVRTGRAVATLDIPNPDLQLWPIPQRDIDTNSNLEQNPGY